MTQVAVIGTGSVGQTLGRRLAQKGYSILFGSRQPQSEKVLRLVAENPDRLAATQIADAIGQCSTVIMAIPYGQTQSVIESSGPWSGKVLVDCTNPLNRSFDGIELGFNDSAAEQIARWAGGAAVVKAFNTASVATMNNPTYSGHQATMFYCGDQVQAKLVVRQMIADLDMEPIDSGPLTSARYLEPLAMLYIHLAIREGWGANCAFKMLKR
jgi:predicted dinucleotide-binding enzyme